MIGGATEAGSDPLAAPLRLPCGATLPNRLCKAAMTEGLADPKQRATERHVRLYRAWSEGGVGLSITGNVMIDRHVIERPGNVAIDVTHRPHAVVRPRLHPCAVQPDRRQAALRPGRRLRLHRGARRFAGGVRGLDIDAGHAMTRLRRLLLSGLVGAGITGIPGFATAKAWPEPGVKLVVPLTPGSGADTAARALAQSMGKAWKQIMVVHKKPGAGAGH